MHAVWAECGPQHSHDTPEARQRLHKAEPVIAEFLHQVKEYGCLGGALCRDNAAVMPVPAS